MSNTIYFTYDGVHSSTYDLQIAEFDTANIKNTTVLTPTLNTVKSANLRRSFYNGISYEEITQHPLTILSKYPVEEAMKREILCWLTGRNGFKTLQIHRDDLEGYSYRCIFTNVDVVYINGICYGFTITANFDSPYQYGSPTAITVNGDGSEQEVIIINKSDIFDDYAYPIVEFTTPSGIEDDIINISIINTTDNVSRKFEFHNLPPNTKITIDNEMKTIESSVGGEKLSNFNKNWLRLKRGKNILKIKINGAVTITCPQYVMIGF